MRRTGPRGGGEEEELDEEGRGRGREGAVGVEVLLLLLSTAALPVDAPPPPLGRRPAPRGPPAVLRGAAPRQGRGNQHKELRAGLVEKKEGWGGGGWEGDCTSASPALAIIGRGAAAASKREE